MKSVIVLQDAVSHEDGIRRVHLMDNEEIKYTVPEGAIVEVSFEAGIHHLKAEWLARGAIEIQCEGWPRPKRFIMRPLEKGQRMSETIKAAAEEYYRLFGGMPMYAFTGRLPANVESGVGVQLKNGYEVLLFEADWMMERFVAVGGKDPDPTPPLE